MGHPVSWEKSGAQGLVKHFPLHSGAALADLVCAVSQSGNLNSKASAPVMAVHALKSWESGGRGQLLYSALLLPNSLKICWKWDCTWEIGTNHVWHMACANLPAVGARRCSKHGKCPGPLCPLVCKASAGDKPTETGIGSRAEAGMGARGLHSFTLGGRNRCLESKRSKF